MLTQQMLFRAIREVVIKQYSHFNQRGENFNEKRISLEREISGQVPQLPRLSRSKIVGNLAWPDPVAQPSCVDQVSWGTWLVLAWSGWGLGWGKLALYGDHGFRFDFCLLYFVIIGHLCNHLHEVHHSSHHHNNIFITIIIFSKQYLEYCFLFLHLTLHPSTCLEREIHSWENFHNLNGISLPNLLFLVFTTNIITSDMTDLRQKTKVDKITAHYRPL